MKISDKIRMVLLTFVIPKEDDLPKDITETQEETKDELDARRRKHVPGEVIIERTEDCCLFRIVEGFQNAGFAINRAVRKAMADGRWQVKIEFGRDADVEDPDEEFEDQIETAVMILTGGAFWAVRVYENPFFVNGVADSEGKMISLFLDGRKTLITPKGDPVLQWQKDEDGYRIGDAPVPIMPKYHLTIVDDTIQLVPA